MIEVNNLRFRYPMKFKLFNDVSFNIGSGKIVGLLGKNGEGKTTLLKLLGGQLLRLDGKMNVFGEDPGKRSVHFLSNVFYLPEVFHIPKGVTIRSYFNALKGFYPNFSEKIAAEAMHDFEIDYDMKLNKISQGQQKKAFITFALAVRAQVLLMDEPTNGLDIPSKSAFRRLLAKHTSDDQTIIISTHQVRDLEQIIDHIMVMHINKIILNDSLANLSEYFTFRTVGKDETALYQEMTPAGMFGIFKKDQDDDSTFSTELFFNALISDREKILKLIPQQ
ncbi:ABC transporter ATP-binding protein [Porphyromonas cangingivalis]|uniref:ATP-binding cassette domain-containing protein n=1 Tax=Porphyromonas cangingivalis TaxID=36874 RepID=UPI00051D6395|nr:ABC transporter ATP-binding protein [Porphyromonas cangingivalis]KGL50506.1 ABC transporter ATP-binding protein [Porphyromonas cangingivalis]